MIEENSTELRARAAKLYRVGDLIGALKTLDRMIELEIAEADDWCMTGQLLAEVGEFAQALGAFEQCLKLDAQHVAARYDLGRALYKLGDADRASQLIEHIAEETNHPEVWMGLATIAPGVPGYDQERVRQIRERYAQVVRREESPITHFVPQPNIQRDVPRVGYLSAHFHDERYMKPVWPLINSHDFKKFEIHLFDDAADATPTWDWLHGIKPQIHTVHWLNNRQLVEAIRSAEIDILVDLSAYSKPERLGIYVHRSAPVQMAWFNMYATSGIHEMDFIIGDRLVLHPNERRFYTEQVRQLPVSYLTFQTNHSAPPVSESPCLSNGYVTFGCLGTLYKITPPVVQAWSQILVNAPTAKLLLANSDLKSICNQQFVLDQFHQQGVLADQISFLPPANHFEFLQYYDRIDIALDTFPYNGGTTTMEALWQGAPVLTFDGDRWASRTSFSIIGHSHLRSFVARTRQGFVDLGIQYATDRSKQDSLRSIRSTMREKLQASSVCDSEGLARAMESIFLGTWKQRPA